MVEVRHIRIDHEGFETIKGKIIVHLSDLHISQIGRREKKILKIIKEIEPDMIFLTGDYIKWKGDYEPAIVFLSKLKAKTGVWAVMGDYDYSTSRKSCLFCHEPGTGRLSRRHKINFLRNETEAVQLGEGSLYIHGVDRLGNNIEGERLLMRKGVNPLIVLSHDPISFDLIDQGQNLLMLSGDTHGGQIPLPSVIWKIIGYEKNVKYSHGFFQKGSKKMFVSKGIGTSHIPIRILRRPEVAVFHF